MNTRLLVLRAGSASTNNLIRSLKSGDPSCFIVGCHDDGFVLKKSLADRNLLVPASTRDNFERVLRQIVKSEHIDLIIPNSEPDVVRVSDLPDYLACRTFLPAKTLIDRCQDKYALTTFLRGRGLPVPATYAVDSLEDIEQAFSRLPSATQVWCRIRRGSGSSGAIPVKTPGQARGWIEYWEDMRGIPKGSFTLSEFLPGRDLTVQCLFKAGTLVMSKSHERLSYHVLGNSPSGVSSTAALAKMVHEPLALQVSVEAIRVLDSKASGVFFVDLKEDAQGKACITEINVGRFANVPTIHDAFATDNMVTTYVRAALGQSVEIRQACGYDEDYYVLRGLDMLPVVLRASELFKGVEDVR